MPPCIWCMWGCKTCTECMKCMQCMLAMSSCKLSWEFTYKSTDKNIILKKWFGLMVSLLASYLRGARFKSCLHPFESTKYYKAFGLVFIHRKPIWPIRLSGLVRLDRFNPILIRSAPVLGCLPFWSHCLGCRSPVWFCQDAPVQN